MNDWATLIGILTGTVALVLGVLNYRRDAPKVRVRILWDMIPGSGEPYDPTKKYAVIEVGNTGRRPICVSHAHFTLPSRLTKKRLVLREGLPGKRLAEGDPPESYMFDQELIGTEPEYLQHWSKIRAVVIDSAGKHYYSKRVKKKPAWVKD